MLLTFTANDSLEFSYTLNYVIKCVNDLKILLSSCAEKLEEFPSAREYKSFLNPSGTRQRSNKYLSNFVFSVRTVSYGTDLELG